MTTKYLPNYFIATLVQVLPKGSARSEVYINSLTTFDGQTVDITSWGQENSVGTIIVDPQSSTTVEYIKFTGIDGSGIGFTGCTGGLSSLGDGTSITNNLRFHPVGATVIIGFSSYDLQNFVDLFTNQNIPGLKAFTSLANTPTVAVGTKSGNQVISFTDAQAIISGLVGTATTTTYGTVKTTTSTNTVVSTDDTRMVPDDTSIAYGSGNKPVSQTGFQINAENTATTTGAANTYLATLAPVPVALSAGMSIQLLTNFANTGPALLAIGGVKSSMGTVTVTIATPAVFSFTSHGLVAGDIIQLTTTGALPTGLSVGTDYYVISSGLTSGAFEVSTTLGGSAVNTTGSQSGTHTLYRRTKNITKNGTAALVSGDIANAQEISLVYDGTQWQLQSPSANPPVLSTGFANGTTTFDLSTSGAENIAHGLGVVPKFVRITGIKQSNGSSTTPAIGISVYNGTTQSSYTYDYTNGVSVIANAFQFYGSNNGVYNTGVITVTSTNIVITWTKTGSPTGTLDIVWEAQA